MNAAIAYLNDAALREDASASIVKIALAQEGAEGAGVKAAMQRVMQVATSADARRGAAEVLASLDVVNRGWQIVGPFPLGDKGFNTDFGPEKGVDLNASYKAIGGTARWKPAVIQPNGYVDLNAQLNPHDNVVAYAVVYVKSPEARTAIFSAGSDDGMKAWINGDLVDSKDGDRGATPGEDQAQVHLKAGWNTVLLKIIQGGGDWGYYFDLLNPDRTPMIDIEYSGTPG